MTFVIDLVAMIFAQPRALLPAIGAVMIGGGEATVDPAGLDGRGVPGRAVLRPAGRRPPAGCRGGVVRDGLGRAVAAFGLVVVLAGRPETAA